LPSGSGRPPRRRDLTETQTSNAPLSESDMCANLEHRGKVETGFPCDASGKIGATPGHRDDAASCRAGNAAMADAKLRFQRSASFPMESFSPLTASLGGVLIGLAAAVLWLGNGRIAGIAGIFGHLLPPGRAMLWRLVFLTTLIAAAWASARLFPQLGAGGVEPSRLASPPEGWSVPMPVWLVIA